MLGLNHKYRHEDKGSLVITGSDRVYTVSDRSLKGSVQIPPQLCYTIDLMTRHSLALSAIVRNI
jgi:hypothetical protein